MVVHGVVSPGFSKTSPETKTMTIEVVRVTSEQEEDIDVTSTVLVQLVFAEA